jgi:hypothetical protein
VGGTLPLDVEVLAERISRARRLFDRIIVVDNSNWSMLMDFAPTTVDTVVLALAESAYERQLTRPGDPHGHSPAPALALSPVESAVKWRERELGQRSLGRLPLAGVLLLSDPRQQASLPDAFTTQVEEQLTRYGTPILGRYPRTGLMSMTQRSGVTTVLDPIGPDEHDRILKGATSLASRLWPGMAPLCSPADATARSRC